VECRPKDGKMVRSSTNLHDERVLPMAYPGGGGEGNTSYYYWCPHENLVGFAVGMLAG